jgi:hypothetical protein
MSTKGEFGSGTLGGIVYSNTVGVNVANGGNDAYIAYANGLVLGATDLNPSAPTAVQNLRVTSANNGATVYFDAPLSGLADSYKITTTPSTSTTSTTSASATTVISGLANGTSYTITVTPVTVGKSGTSSTSSAITPKAGPTGLTAITGLTLWYDAAQESYSNLGNVTSLTDWSGSGYNSTAVSATNPTFLSSWTNGKPSVTFTSGSSTFVRSGITQANIGSKMTCFMVMDTSDAAGNQRHFSFKDSTGNSAFAFLDHNLTNLRAGSDNSAICSIAISTSTPLIASFSCGNGLYMNGTKATNTLSYSPVISGLTQRLHIASDLGTSVFASMHMAEMLIWNRELTQTERWAVEAYLATKYNITVVQA